MGRRITIARPGSAMYEVTIKRIPSGEQGSITFCALMTGRQIGKAQLSINKQSAVLADIYVANIAPKWFWLPPFYSKGINYRGKKVGTELLLAVVEYCKHSEIKELSGVMHGEIELLAQWYRKNGFEISEQLEIHRQFST